MIRSFWWKITPVKMKKSGLSKRNGGGICSSSSEGEKGDENSDEEEEADFKIYFCSRTHSQLSQFVKELKKTIFANEIKVASLGSRKNFCINEEFRCWEKSMPEKVNWMPNA